MVLLVLFLVPCFSFRRGDLSLFGGSCFQESYILLPLSSRIAMRVVRAPRDSW
jgi:hypothetical protein